MKTTKSGRIYKITYFTDHPLNRKVYMNHTCFSYIEGLLEIDRLKKDRPSYRGVRLEKVRLRSEVRESVYSGDRTKEDDGIGFWDAEYEMNFYNSSDCKNF